MEPERVAPGRPARGVSPMEVSWERPDLMQQAEAPEPRWRAMMLREEAGLPRWEDTYGELLWVYGSNSCVMFDEGFYLRRL